jgi:NADH-quinone oxidoreductase subunit M
MVPVLLILIPLLSGLAGFFTKGENAPRTWALFSSIITLCVFLAGVFFFGKADNLLFEAEWMTDIGSNVTLSLDGMGKMLCLLTAMGFPLIFAATFNKSYANPNQFYALMLLAQAGLMGVFVATDGLLFYFFWELALIPVYFLCSRWGGEKRIAVTFKFFIYTFIGSLLMLVVLMYLYFRTEGIHSFSMEAFYSIKLNNGEQSWLFWLFFMAFAIKMPIFPFHTWQPDTYEQAPSATTMVLSGIMVKMGVFGLIRWLMPIMPVGAYLWQDTVTTLAIIGMIYASFIAIRQDDLKRLVAYSSIAHIGLMCAAVFADTKSGMQGVMLQMFNHGINIIGLWIVVDLIEKKTGSRKISELGGLAQKAPVLTIFMLVIALANIALPLTNAFVGEFMMFNGIFASTITKYNMIFTVTAGISIILAAVYTLRMIQRVFYGETNTRTAGATDISLQDKLVLSVVVVCIFMMGIYAKPMVDMTADTVEIILQKMTLKF